MRISPAVLMMVVARLLAAQTPDATARGSLVSGIVHDSVGRRPLAGAVVQLVDAADAARFVRAATADSLGRYAIAGVPAGRYIVGFVHPVLDSLGVEPLLRDVRVDGITPIVIGLATPSPARLRSAICGAGAGANDALVMGVVRDTRDGAPLRGATVSGEWMEFSFTANGVVRRMPRVVVSTADNGWFAMCDVPAAGTLSLKATRGADSTDRVEVQIPADRFLRRELYLGGARAARLSGTVVSAIGARPIPGAQVSVAGGPQTRADQRGDWTLANVPQGTRTLSVLAVGYYPERRVVDVMPEAPAIRTAMATMQAVLDTVRVNSARANSAEMRGFDERRRGGIGRYLTADDVRRRSPVVTSELLLRIPGLAVERQELASPAIRMRSFGELCTPAFYIDGRYMNDFDADDLDDWVRPDEIAGVEIYAGAGVPPQFSTGMAGGIQRADSAATINTCGSIVIWTRPSVAPPSRASWKARAATFLILAGAAIAVAAVIRH